MKGYGYSNLIHTGCASLENALLKQYTWLYGKYTNTVAAEDSRV